MCVKTLVSPHENRARAGTNVPLCPGYAGPAMSEKTVETRESQDPKSDGKPTASPGLVLVWSMGKPALVPLRIESETVIGRGSFAGALDLDDRVSRTHARISATLELEDLGSRNGTLVNGERVKN